MVKEEQGSMPVIATCSCTSISLTALSGVTQLQRASLSVAAENEVAVQQLTSA